MRCVASRRVCFVIHFVCPPLFLSTVRMLAARPLKGNCNLQWADAPAANRMAFSLCLRSTRGAESLRSGHFLRKNTWETLQFRMSVKERVDPLSLE